MNRQLSALLNSSEASKPRTGSRHDHARGRPIESPTRDWRLLCAAWLPWAMLLGSLGLLAALLGHRILPARQLAIATVVTVRQGAEAPLRTRQSAASESAGGQPGAASFDAPMIFQASGWVEPEPYPVMATALVDGIIETVDVLEGQEVESGQLLATLIADDARLDLETAKNQLASWKAQAAGHEQQIAMVEAELESLAKQVSVAGARRNESADLARQLHKALSSGIVAKRDVDQAGLKLATREAELDALGVTEAELKAKLRRLEEIRAEFAARIAEAETETVRKQLALNRTRIESPIDGRVLRLLAVPGQKKVLRMDHPESATVAILYDPQKLQARIDVPLAEAAQLAAGQPVRLRTELLPDLIFRGRVTRIAGEADLQRNTLQAKVAIENPDDRLRPEMLCRAEFLASPAPRPSGSGPGNSVTRAAASLPSEGSPVRIYVPVAALAGAGPSANETEASVWKVDRSGDHVVPQSITLGLAIREDHRLVLEGLKPGDRVVLNPSNDLKPGDRIRPAESTASKRLPTTPES